MDVSGELKRPSDKESESTLKRSKLSSNESESTVSGSSPFELLPKELHFMIYGFAPGAVFELRLTSPVLKSYVDEFAMQASTITFVHLLHLNSHFNPRKGKSDMISIEALVDKSVSNLLELRVKLRKPTDEIEKGLMRQEFTTLIRKYELEYVPEEDGDKILEFLNKCFGKRIGHLSLVNYDSMEMVHAVSKTLDGIHFKGMDILTIRLDDKYINSLLEFVESHNVETLCLVVNQLQTANPVDTLLRLSSLVRSLELNCNDYGQEHETAHFMGVRDIDWAPVILDMFSRKLDMLSIINEDYPEYLSERCGNELRKRLPALNKKIWFEATFVHTLDNIESDSKEYLIQAEEEVLHIKHKTRADELFENFCE